MLPTADSPPPGETAGYNRFAHHGHPEPPVSTFSTSSTSPRPRRCRTGAGAFSLMVSASEDHQDDGDPRQPGSHYSGSNSFSTRSYELYQPGRSQLRTHPLSSQESFGTLPGTTSSFYSSPGSFTYQTDDFPPTNTQYSSYGNGNSMSLPVYPDLSLLAPPPHHHDTSPSPPSPTASLLNANAPVGHFISDILVSKEDIREFMKSHDSGGTGSASWRLGTFKCMFPGCTSTAVEPARINTHLALHLNSKKAYKCTCGTQFGRLSEANRHLEDQKPCVVCRQPRRKDKTTGACSRCVGGTRSTRGRGL